jgi:LacI family transcriptional regulator
MSKKIMDTQKNKPTIEDVARYCGVSVSTVSRVINRSTPVSAELNLKVRQAIKELGFTPRQWKDRTLRKTVVLAIPDILNLYYSEIMYGAQEEADRLGISMIIVNISEDPDLQKAHFNLLAQWMFDGLIVTGTWLPSRYLNQLHTDYNMPIVVARSKETPEFPCITPNTGYAIYQAAKYLLNLNHRRIAYISGPPEWHSTKVRRENIQRALSEAGISFPDELQRWCSPTVEEGFQATRSLLTLPPDARPTAILAFNDIIAVGALRAIYMAGLRAPDDISVIGADDVALAAHTIPALTTISQPTYRIGQLTVQKMADLLQGVPLSNDLTLLECPLIVRESTAPCPQS